MRIWPACLVNEKIQLKMAVKLDASQYFITGEIGDVFKSFQNGLAIVGQFSSPPKQVMAKLSILLLKYW